MLAYFFPVISHGKKGNRFSQDLSKNYFTPLKKLHIPRKLTVGRWNFLLTWSPFRAGMSPQNHLQSANLFKNGKEYASKMLQIWKSCRHVILGSTNHWSSISDTSKSPWFHGDFIPATSPETTHRHIIHSLNHSSKKHGTQKWSFGERGWFSGSIWVFPKIGVPQNGWFIRENPIKIDDLGAHPHFWKHPY